MQHPFQKVKIVATLGPASTSPDMIEKLILAGVNIFRINLSHSSKDESLKKIRLIRAAENKTKKTVSILGDLAGPKIRIGDVPGGTVFLVGEHILISRKPHPQKKYLTLNFPSIIQNLELGADIYLGDGIIKLNVLKKINEGVEAIVVVGGKVASRLGFSAEGLALAHFELTAKDRQDIAVMSRADIDALAISFVQTPKDITAVLQLLPRNNRPVIIAKIETANAVKNADRILDVADGIMIARGDLGLSIPMAELPHVQKHLIQLALKHAKPVITATQMLESMIYNPLPTRAEITDVANAILDGTDAVMLSGETAVGKFPEETVKMMAKIIHSSSGEVSPKQFYGQDVVPDAISASVTQVADQVGARLIIAFTQKGGTPRRIARHRHTQPIIAVSPEPRTLHMLNFSWGVCTLKTKEIKNVDELLKHAHAIAAKNPVLPLKKGELFVISAGLPFGKTGTTNLLLVQTL